MLPLLKATQQYFPAVLFILLYRVVLTFESVDEILKCDHSYPCSYQLVSRGPIDRQAGKQATVVQVQPVKKRLVYKFPFRFVERRQDPSARKQI